MKPFNDTMEEDKDGDGGGDGRDNIDVDVAERLRKLAVSRESMVKGKYPVLPEGNADDSDVGGGVYDKAIALLMEKGKALYADTCNNGTH